MTLTAGSRLGPYEIVGLLGSGGMGEVYRAKDERLKREVAIKVLPASLSGDADRLRRFEQEAQAAGGLNHPNITAVHDFGTHEEAPYIVTELLEGETLRARLSGGALSPRKAIDYAGQIARGLAAAHEKGIVHRDLKPENLFLTKDGRVKILDFGLAKLTQSEAASGAQTNLPTAAGTEPGVVMGTLGYMSPEQVKGRPADARSDIFAFGAILYEMLSGARAFHGPSSAETMSAILREDPPDLSATNRSIPPGLERIVRHCLEKNPEERFFSARDLAFDLEALSGLSGPATGPAVSSGVRRRPSWALLVAAVAATALLVGAWAMLAVRKAGNRPPPSFRQLTFRRGQIFSARFAPDGQTIMYSAGWDGKPMEIFVGRPESPESRPFGLTGAEVLSISKSGDMAVSLNRRVGGGFRRTGTLAQLSVAGGAAPRDILREIEWADWGPDGKSLAIVRVVPGRMRIEYPIGKVLYETSAWVGHLRVSPRGDSVAFIDHPTPGDDGGSVASVDLAGKKKSLSKPFASAQGLAWSPDGSEVWFTATEIGGNRAVYSTRSGDVRLRVRVPGNLTLQDISKEGRMLISRDSQRNEFLGLAPGESKERELTWLDWSLPATISRDGRTVLFSESGEGGGAGYSVYIRKTDGSPAVRLGEGSSQDLSPDGEWALAIVHSASDPQLAAYPTGAGEPKIFSKEGISVFSASFLGDGKQILLTGSEPGRGPRLYLRDFSGGKPRAVTPEGYTAVGPVDPNGKWAVVDGPDRKRYLYPLSSGEPTPIPGLDPEDGVAQVSADGRFVYVRRRAEVPMKVYRLEIATGRKELWRTLMPGDGAGVSNLTPLPTPDGSAYIYSYVRTLSDLFLVEGVR